MNCDQFDFSPARSQTRLHQARALFGERIVNRILAWALFLLGASKPMICSTLGLKPGSLRTLLYRLQHQGLGALEDRRCKTSTFKRENATAALQPLRVSLHQQDDLHQIRFSDFVEHSNTLLQSITAEIMVVVPAQQWRTHAPGGCPSAATFRGSCE